MSHTKPKADLSEACLGATKTPLVVKLDRYGVLVTVVNISCLLVIVIISMYIMDQTTQSPPVSQEVCIDCAELSQQDVNVFSRRRDNGTEMCCADNQEHMTALLIASIREQVPDPGTSSSKDPVSAHKRLFPPVEHDSSLTEPYFNGGRKHFHATFNKDFYDPDTEHVNGVEVLNSSLRISSTGLYFVYFSNYLAPEFNKTAKDFEYQSWLPYVFRKSKNDPASTGRLLQTSYTAHEDSVDTEETVYSGGTFYLFEGDELHVCISGLGLVRYTKEASFLGVVKLDGDCSSICQ